ncbi:MAG: hypothetical protein ACR2Q4_24525 [Geminicoccaceae bacterium]
MMMEEMMKQCCGPEGKPDFEKMKKFMEMCGKAQFGEEEIRMMEECCGQERKLDVERMKELMEKCGCRLPESTA